jgi:hypothetical protein
VPQCRLVLIGVPWRRSSSDAKWMKLAVAARAVGSTCARTWERVMFDLTERSLMTLPARSSLASSPLTFKIFPSSIRHGPGRLSGRNGLPHLFFLLRKQCLTNLATSTQSPCSGNTGALSDSLPINVCIRSRNSYMQRALRSWALLSKICTRSPANGRSGSKA